MTKRTYIGCPAAKYCQKYPGKRFLLVILNFEFILFINNIDLLPQTFCEYVHIYYLLTCKVLFSNLDHVFSVSRTSNSRKINDTS